MRVGWARPGCLPDQDLGSDDQAFVFDGFKVWFTLRAVNCASEKKRFFLCVCVGFVFVTLFARFNAGTRATSILDEPGRLAMWLDA